MSFTELQRAALALNESDRAQLAAVLLDTLADRDPSDAEALERDAALERGDAEEISYEEMVRRVASERRR